MASITKLATSPEPETLQNVLQQVRTGLRTAFVSDDSGNVETSFLDTVRKKTAPCEKREPDGWALQDSNPTRKPQ